MFDENYNNIQNEFKTIDYNNYNNLQITQDIYKDFLKNHVESISVDSFFF